MSKCKYNITLSDGSLLEIPTDFDKNNEANLKKSLMNWLLNSSEESINKVLSKEEITIPDKYKGLAISKTSLKDVVFSGENNKLLNHIKNTFPEFLSEENIIFTENYGKDYDYDSENNIVIINAPTYDDETFLKGILNKILFDYNKSQNKNLLPNDSQFISYIGGDFENTINALYDFDFISKSVENKAIIIPSAKGKMTYLYGDNKRSDIKSKSTFEAIKNGERIATTRYKSDGHIDYWSKLKLGDIIEWESSTGEKILVKITKPLTKLPENTSAEEWSKKEGWSTNYFNKNVKPKINEAYQMEYQLISSNTVSEPIVEEKIEPKEEVSTLEVSEEKPAINSIVFSDKIEISTGEIILNSQQVKALRDLSDFFNAGFRSGNMTFGLKGYAGSGKTTLINLFLKYVKTKTPFKTIRLSSPTNRANAVMRQKGVKNVSTLHSLFGLSPEVDLETFDVRTAKFVKKSDADTLGVGDVLLIDESSMINDELYKFIKEKSAELRVQVIFMGDSAQLKPVGQTTLSKAFTDNDKSVELTIVERTGKNPLLKESTDLRNKVNAGDFSYKTNLQKGEGIVFVNNTEEFINKASELFSSDEFTVNPLLLRIVSATNAEVVSMNNKLRNNIWGKDASNEYNVGEILMGYSNFNKNKKGDYEIYNGGDYQVVSSIKSTKSIIPGIKYDGFDLTLRDLISGETKSIFMLSKNTSETALNILGQNFESLRLNAISMAPGPAKNLAWVKFFNFGNSFATPIPISYNGSRKISPTLQYGYAHTIHKSQGGTYTYSFVLGNSIDSGFSRDNEQQNQLRYVGTTRAEKVAIILTNKGDVNTIPNLDSLSEENLKLINKKFNTSYTREQFKALSKEEQDYILKCL